jgi:hypothetical protein
MAVVCPNIEDAPAYAAMAVRDAVDMWALTSDAQSTGVLSGCAVTATGGAMSVAVAAGSVVVAGTTYVVSGSTLTIGAASTSDRRDTVVYTAGTGLQVIAGGPCGYTSGNWTTSVTSNNPPVKQYTTGSYAVPTNSVVLAEVYVAGTGGTATTSSTLTTANNLVDKRNVLGGVDVIGGQLQDTLNVEQIVRLNSLDQMSPPAADMSMNARRLVNVAIPLFPTDAATGYAGMSTVTGAPTTGTWNTGNWIVDATGKIYYCTAPGTPGTWAAAVPALAASATTALASNTNTTATLTTQTFVSGTAKQLSTTNDVMLYCRVTAAVVWSLNLGPTSTPSTTMINIASTSPAVLYNVSYRVPAGWYVSVTCATMASITFTQVTC